MHGGTEQFEAELAVLARRPQVLAELTKQRTLVGPVLKGAPGEKRLIIDRHAEELGLVHGLGRRRHALA